MAKPNAARLRQAGKPGLASPGPSAVGDEITRHLRALQAQRAQTLDVDAIIAGLVPALAALAGRGLLVSVTVSRDSRSVRLSALIDREWIEWYTADPDEAEDLAASIVAAMA